MSVAGAGAIHGQARAVDVAPASAILLARIATEGGATRSEIARDLSPLFSHKLSPADWRRAVETRLGHLIAAGFATETRGCLRATEAGEAAAGKFLGRGQGLPSWPEQRDIFLVAKGLRLDGESPSLIKVLARPEGLRAVIVQKAYGLRLKKNQPPAKIRAQLALIALERAFGNKIKAELGKGSSLSSKAARLLAGQLSRSPRDFGTDARLIAELAAEHVDAPQSDLDALRAAILRNLAGSALAAETGTQAKANPAPRVLSPAANDTAPSAQSRPPHRPDVREFAREVMHEAKCRAEGWPGNRKAYISHVWQAIRDRRAEWCLSEIEFKCMLAEAHRAGQIVLANADLKDKKNMADIESSATLYKNTVWHFVRVED